MTDLSRRSFLAGLGAAAVAPALPVIEREIVFTRIEPFTLYPWQLEVMEWANKEIRVVTGISAAHSAPARPSPS